MLCVAFKVFFFHFNKENHHQIVNIRSRIDGNKAPRVVETCGDAYIMLRVHAGDRLRGVVGDEAAEFWEE